MQTTPTTMKSTSDDLKKQGGRWLRALRDQRGLSQKDLATLVDVQNSIFISQLENGRVRIAPERYERWAEAYGLSAYEFVKTLLSFYDPVTFRLLFETDASLGSQPAELARDDDSERMQSAVVSSQNGREYVDALYRLLGKKAAELESLQAELGLADSRAPKRI